VERGEDIPVDPAEQRSRLEVGGRGDPAARRDVCRRVRIVRSRSIISGLQIGRGECLFDGTARFMHLCDERGVGEDGFMYEVQHHLIEKIVTVLS